jgi:hypothetical protein
MPMPISFNLNMEAVLSSETSVNYRETRHITKIMLFIVRCNYITYLNISIVWNKGRVSASCFILPEVLDSTHSIWDQVPRRCFARVLTFTVKRELYVPLLNSQQRVQGVMKLFDLALQFYSFLLQCFVPAAYRDWRQAIHYYLIFQRRRWIQRGILKK